MESPSAKPRLTLTAEESALALAEVGTLQIEFHNMKGNAFVLAIKRKFSSFKKGIVFVVIFAQTI